MGGEEDGGKKQEVEKKEERADVERGGGALEHASAQFARSFQIMI